MPMPACHQGQGVIMGLLVDGKWQDQWYDTASTGGRFIRSDAQFRNWITADGRPGPSGTGGFRAEPGRYHQIGRASCREREESSVVGVHVKSGRATVTASARRRRQWW